MSTLSVNNVTEVGGAPVVTNGVLDSGSLPTGTIIAVKNVTKSDVFSASIAAGAFTTVTGLTLSHAVSSASNKIILLAFVHAGWAANANNEARMQLQADGTPISIGDTAGSRVSATSATAGSNGLSSAVLVAGIEHAPGSTSAVTYSVAIGHFAASAQTSYVNRTYTDTDNVSTSRVVSSLVLMEVAG